ncbi:dihydropteroate synthase [Candidatus Sumerlaeota bacterium]|nr:dihydropteroate synthase [Candidatus Sumerlaeota bacterium]
MADVSPPSSLIQVGELLHASIPSSGKAIRELLARGEMGFHRPSAARDSVREIVASQAAQGAAYIDINVDAVDGDRQAAMRRFVSLVREDGNEVPPSIDSSDPAVLVAGLTAWSEMGADSETPTLAPLVNSVPYIHMDQYQAVLDLRRRWDFGLVCLLIGLEGPLPSADAVVDAARAMLRKAVDAGFEPDQVFFDTVTLGMASDGCMNALGELKPSHTYNSFEAIRRIRQDEETSRSHCILGVSNWAYGASKRRIGHIRAYLEVAMRYGLDAAILDVSKEFGKTPAPPELVELVEVFASLDGNDESMLTYGAAMKKAREEGLI